MSHFSKFIRPGAVRIGFDSDDDELMVTALQNPDGSKVVVLLNMSDEAKPIQLNAEGTASFTIQAQALQTIVLP
jgi:glucosylceramidase